MGALAFPPAVLLHPRQPGELPSSLGRRGEGQGQIPRDTDFLLLLSNSGE